MAYITSQKVQDYLAMTFTDQVNDQVANWIDIVEEYIDNFTNRNFEESNSEVRYFDGNSSDVLRIDDVTSITELVFLDSDGDTDTTLTEDTDFRLYPYNNDEKTEIRLMPGGSRAAFPAWDKSVKVTGTWGYSSVPKVIEAAALKLVSRFVEKSMKGGEIIEESLGDYKIKLKDIDEEARSMGVIDLLNQYVRHEFL